MPNEMENLEGLVDAIADVVLRRLTGQLNLGPAGEPLPQLPELPGQLKDAPLLVRPKLHMQGLELTQSTQYYGTGYGPENSVPIVALKPLVVRAYPYVSAGMLEGDALSGKTVTGELVLLRWGKEVYRTGPTRSAGSRVGPASRVDRDLWDEETNLYASSGRLETHLISVKWNPPLNFFVPAWHVRSGPTTAVVRAWLTSGEGGTVTASEAVQVIPVNVPKLALVRVNWKNTATNAVIKPSDADLLGLVGLATRMLPFPYYETTILGIEKTKSGDFSGAPMNADGTPNPGGCNTAWVDLLTELKVTRLLSVIFGVADIVYGVVPRAGALTLVGTRNTGCGWGDDGVGGCLVGDQPAFAHEVGHLYGCGHIGDKTLASYDASYPNYGGSKTLIGETGIDTALDGAPLSSPHAVHDLMSYKGPQWVSPYTYLKILDNREKHMSTAADPRRVRSFLVVRFAVDRMVDGFRKAEKLKAYVAQGPGIVPRPKGAALSNWYLELVDGNQRIISSHACRVPTSLGGGCGCCGDESDIERATHLEFVEAMEFPEEVASIQLSHGEKHIARLEVGEGPSVEVRGPEQREGSLDLHIRVHHPREEPSLLVLFTGDDGETWQPIAIDPEQHDPLAIDTSTLQGGRCCRFRVVATAELRSASADSESFSLPRKDRVLEIDVSESYCAKGRVDLHAMIDLRGHEGVAPHEIMWRSDTVRELGRGYHLSADLEEGRHVITATIPGGASDRVGKTAMIVVGGKGR